MSLDDWILALHVLSAFAFVTGVGVFWLLIVSVRGAESPAATLRAVPLARFADAATGTGATGTIVFGVWLALSVGGYDIWDPWIVAALVLWLVATGFGRLASAWWTAAAARARELDAAGEVQPSRELNRASAGVVFHALASATVLLLLLDMIWKPGA